MDFARRTLHRDGVDLSYLDSGGSGPAVVYLHGLTGCAAEMTTTAQGLGSGYRHLLLDQRGHGYSTRFPSDVGRSAFTADVAELIRAATGQGPVLLVGQSMGGHTAVLTAAELPQLVGALVLLEAEVSGSNPSGTDSLGSFLRSWPLPFPSRSAAAAWLGDGPLPRAWLDGMEERPDGLRPRFDPGVMEEISKSMQRPRWDEWRRVAAPALAVFAGRGFFTAEQKDAFIAARPETDRVDLPQASHDAHLDAYDQWSAVLRTWTDTHWPAGAGTARAGGSPGMLR